MSNYTRKLVVVGLVGKKRSGKDTLYQFIKEEFPFARRLAFADPLKAEVFDLLHGIESVPGDLQKFANFCHEHLIDLEALPRTVCAGSFTRQQKLDWVEANKAALRTILQRWGTEGRRAESPRYWIDQLDKDLRELDTPLVVVTDVRFADEALYVRAGCAGILVRVIRLDLPDEKDTHASEALADTIGADVAVSNPGGTIAEFQKAAQPLLNYLRGKIR